MSHRFLISAPRRYLPPPTTENWEPNTENRKLKTTLPERYRVARRAPDLVVLEGFHALKHALRFGAELLDVRAVRLDEVERLAAGLAPDVADRIRSVAETVEDDVFARLSPTPHPTGIIALARRPVVRAAEIFETRGAEPVVLLEDPRSPWNVGAAVRVAAAAGAAALFVTGSADPWNPATVRGAAGLHFALPVGRIEGLPRTPRPLLAIHPEGDDLAPGSIPPGAILAFGTERHGLGRSILDAADARIRIPMRPGVSSLNLATAVAVTLYAWRLGLTA